MALFQKVVERCDQILTEIKVIMVHLRRQYQTTWARTIIMKVFRMLERNQLIFHPMHDESRRSYIFDLLHVVEPVLYEIFEVFTGLVLSDSSDRFEGRHE